MGDATHRIQQLQQEMLQHRDTLDVVLAALYRGADEHGADGLEHTTISGLIRMLEPIYTAQTNMMAELDHIRGQCSE
jgi:hypothetical protein